MYDRIISFKWIDVINHSSRKNDQTREWKDLVCISVNQWWQFTNEEELKTVSGNAIVMHPESLLMQALQNTSYKGIQWLQSDTVSSQNSIKMTFFHILISTEIITACGRICTSHLLISRKLDNSCPWRITTCQTNTKYSRLQQPFTTFKNCPTQLHRCYVHRKTITIKPSENHFQLPQ